MLDTNPKHKPLPPIAIIGCKTDLLSQNKRKIPLEQAQKAASDRNSSYLECSAFENEGILEVFEVLVREWRKRVAIKK